MPFYLIVQQPLTKKIAVFCKGAGHEILSCDCYFLLAGAFSGVAKSIGAVDATVNMSLSVLPPNLVVAGLFIIASFISISMGTSVGTITALTPIGLGVANATGIPVALVVGAVVGGGMFGDNLSMISDTTIAAVRTQGCELKDKFKVNFFIVLPAAIISLILLVVTTMSFDQTTTMVGSFEWIKVLPYLYILVGALVGINVFALLSSGMISSRSDWVIYTRGYSTRFNSIGVFRNGWNARISYHLFNCRGNTRVN